MSSAMQDFISEMPSADFTSRLQVAVAPELRKNRDSQRRGLLTWISALGLASAAIFAGVHVILRPRNAETGGESEVLNFALEDADLFTEGIVFASDAQAGDLDVLEDYDFLESLEDKDFENV